jgi:hypothetical protein
MDYEANPATNALPNAERRHAGSTDSTVNSSHFIGLFVATFRGPDSDF